MKTTLTSHTVHADSHNTWFDRQGLAQARNAFVKLAHLSHFQSNALDKQNNTGVQLETQ